MKRIEDYWRKFVEYADARRQMPLSPPLREALRKVYYAGAGAVLAELMARNLGDRAEAWAPGEVGELYREAVEYCRAPDPEAGP